MLNNKYIKSNLLLTSFVIGGLFLASPTFTLAEEVATSTESAENKICSGYTYSKTTNSCSLTEVESCDSEDIFFTKEMCELENNVINQRIEERSGGTILDRVKADRKTFIKDRLYEDDSTSQASTDNNINVLSNQIIEAQKQILLFEINNTIIKTRSYIPYFENIIHRLEQNLASSTGAGNEDINSLLLEAKTKIDLASSTISKAENKADSLLVATDIGETINNIKTQIIDTISILKEVREALKQVISITKNIL